MDHNDFEKEETLSWNRYRDLVKFQLSQNRDGIKELNDRIDECKDCRNADKLEFSNRLTKIETRAAIIGTLAGFLSSLLPYVLKALGH